MTLTLLLDLDDTLLNTNQDVFIPAYFQALARELAPHVKPEVMMRALLAGTNLMNASEDFSRTLQEVFDSVFLPQINLSREQINPAIENFYDNIFPTLQKLTSQKPDVKPFINWAFSKGYHVAVATDPLLPRKANYHRVRWAGLDPEQFALVSSYEHFSFTKTHAAYYAEVLGRMGWADGPVLMVGNDMERDIIPAKKLGLATYFINGEATPPVENLAHGSLSDLRKWLETTDHSALIPSFKSMDATLAILSATPAALNGLARDFDPCMWMRKPAPDDWSLTELVCHLRDTEREIHHAQIRLFKEPGEPFIPRPDTSVWASQRNYLHENGADALKEFNNARRETLDLLKNISAADWNRRARHAIFGPTNFLEVASFIADHDRMHVRQAWDAIRKV
jgi:FMN phosphatase YigB (HAD superfamily)